MGLLGSFFRCVQELLKINKSQKGFRRSHILCDTKSFCDSKALNICLLLNKERCRTGFQMYHMDLDNPVKWTNAILKIRDPRFKENKNSI